MRPGALLLALAWLPAGLATASEPLPAQAAGLTFGAGALHAGSGEHPLAPVMGAWARLPLGQACYLEPEAVMARRQEGGAQVSMDERWARGALGLGCATGTRAVRVAASVGPAVSYRRTLVDTEDRWVADSLAPGLRYRAGFLIPLGERWELDVLAGGSTHGWVVDHDLLLQGGVRW